MMKQPPQRPDNLTSGADLAERLRPLLGKKFHLTGKSRTDGANLRKLVEDQLLQYVPDDYVEPRVELAEKGVPKITREFLDTYIVTTGSSYNLQVWNRIPSSSNPLITYDSGQCLTCADVRYALIKVDPQEDIIQSIVVTDANTIEQRFGKFGVPTIKWQLIISDSARREIARRDPPILLSGDEISPECLTDDVTHHSTNLADRPERSEIASTESIYEAVADKLIGRKIAQAATKNRGQSLEYFIISLLGYDVDENSQLSGGYPDLPNQALEIKIQDSPTVDLGKYSPQEREVIYDGLGISTEEMRYLIALTNDETSVVEAVILCPGKELGKHFTYVAGKNYKCQRSIPMSFFDRMKGRSICVEYSSEG